MSLGTLAKLPPVHEDDPSCSWPAVMLPLEPMVRPLEAVEPTCTEALFLMVTSPLPLAYWATPPVNRLSSTISAAGPEGVYMPPRASDFTTPFMLLLLTALEKNFFCG